MTAAISSGLPMRPSLMEPSTFSYTSGRPALIFPQSPSSK